MALFNLLFRFLLVVLIEVHLSLSGCPPITKSPETSFHAVCYDDVGCFDDRPPFTNAKGVLPKSPDELKVELRLFTRQNQHTKQVLSYTDPSALTSTHFDPHKMTKFVIHGFSNNGDTPWVNDLKDGLLKRGDYNVITVDWGIGAAMPAYDQAVANVRVVATQVKMLIDVFRQHGLPMAKLHLIGHSLGAHMSGYVGLLMGGRLGRISGMDPAEPDFECLPTPVRLDPGDAMFVDVIHTNGENFTSGGAGLFQQSGHVDFYVNGGKTQPGCADGIGGAFSSLIHKGFSAVATDVSCSHARSHDIYIESINSQCPFTAFPCESYEKFLRGSCMTCRETGCGSMGFFSDHNYGRGKMFLVTRDKPKYCGFQYFVQLNTSENAVETKGTLFMALEGTYGTTEFVQMTPTDETLAKGATLTSMTALTVEVGEVTTIKLKYHKYKGWGWGWGKGNTEFKVTSASVMSAETGRSFELCKDEYVLKHEEELLVSPKDPTKGCHNVN